MKRKLKSIEGKITEFGNSEANTFQEIRTMRSEILPHKVKTQLTSITNYFLLPWKIPEEISR